MTSDTTFTIPTMTHQVREIELEELRGAIASRHQLREATVKFEHAALRVLSC